MEVLAALLGVHDDLGGGRGLIREHVGGRPSHDPRRIRRAIERRSYCTLARSPHVAVVIPIRRVPAGGGASALQFQLTAALVGVDGPEIDRLRRGGVLSSITGHGELDLSGSYFVRIDLPRRLHTYGLGMPLLSLIRHPLEGGGEVDLGDRTP